MAESERRFEDIARKLATMEGELERSTERCTSGNFTSFVPHSMQIELKHFVIDLISYLVKYISFSNTGEKKISDLEEELRVVGQNLQQLEISEEKALQREENYQNQIKNLAQNLKAAVNRDESATMNIQRLNIRIDQIEEDLLSEKMKIKKISDDLDSTFDDMIRLSCQ